MTSSSTTTLLVHSITPRERSKTLSRVSKLNLWRCLSLSHQTEALQSRCLIIKSSPEAMAEQEVVDPETSTGADVVRAFYEGINRRDLDSVEPLIGEKCMYEDLVFSKPFVGRKAILEFFKKFTGSISKDLYFVIDDISNDDPSAVGVMWHLEWQGRPFPFSKGCSFYRLEVLNGKRQLIYGRDCVEPAMKLGEMALVLP